MFSLYIHIPFCVRKCLYCDFLSGVYEAPVREAYVQALIAELERESVFYKNRTVETIFFGGGTPSLLTKRQLARLMAAIHRSFQVSERAEISFEMNPGTAEQEKLNRMRALGINRLSIGLQSDDDELLKRLGRIHSLEQFQNAYEMARKAGFTNINIDMMSALPGQRLAGYEKTLRTVTGYAPEHISAYSLIIEEGTPFYRAFAEHRLDLPEEEEEREMYYRTKELLREAGYERYEISNYAKKGFACRHNLAYWRRTDYAGFGIGAASLIDGVRYSNVRELKQYLTQTHIKRQIEPLTKSDAMEEFLFLGLRCMEGIRVSEFERQFGLSIEAVYEQQIKELIGGGLLETEGDCLRLTESGIDVSNYVFEKFLI